MKFQLFCLIVYLLVWKLHPVVLRDYINMKFKNTSLEPLGSMIATKWFSKEYKYLDFELNILYMNATILSKQDLS